ncbi:acyl-CoA N-acyltransferase [Fimicolochytrium jonesii]|uniref:acyl-CoA N-acyltransferase n=1 Tax=Fimicolochytrium jonesii TaxID=1396493 RepID=UPI0022FDD9B0|nr:acyl-CoA N-acyltransferase [Fimicolochytrium jonesii]KAI8820568.1 acyl-CoA N-acyltransferase [Fimicolochytrium jonesii]
MSATTTPIHIRKALPQDVPLILAFIKLHAAYEGAPTKCHATESKLLTTLFTPHPYASAIFAVLNGHEVALAIYFFSFSTAVGPCFFLEDLIVAEEYRGRGVGTAILRELAKVCVERGCGRMEWGAFRGNVKAAEFYTKRVGARIVDDSTTFRLEEEALRDMANLDDRKTNEPSAGG